MALFRVLICVFLAAAASAGGLIFGIYYERNLQAAEDEYQAVLESRPRTIAVATLDEGVEQGGVSQKYSAAIIDTLGSQFSLTTYQMAQKGLADGAYDAIVVFPPDFSEKVSSVNAVNPRKISIDYHINGHLPESAYLTTVQTLEDFQVNVNSTLSYMYLVSIYGELHDAQDKSGRLLSNNEKTLSAINNVDDFHFIQNLSLGDLPQIRMEFQPADFRSFADEVNSYVQDMSGVYLSGYADAQAGYQTVTEQLSAEIENTKTAAGQHLDSVLEWQTNANHWLGSAAGRNEDLAAWKADAEKWHDESNAAIEKYQSGFDMVIDQSENFRALTAAAGEQVYAAAETVLNADLTRDYGYIQEYHDALETYSSDLDEYNSSIYIETLLNYIAALEQYIEDAEPYLASWDPGLDPDLDPVPPAFDPNTRPADLDTAPPVPVHQDSSTLTWEEMKDNFDNIDLSFDPGLLQDILDAREYAKNENLPDPLIPGEDIPETLKGLKAEMNDLPESPGLPPEDAGVLDLPDAANVTTDDFKMNLDKVETTAFSYDPLAYLTAADRAEAEGIVRGYHSSLAGVKDEISKLQADHLELVNSAYTEYSKYVSDLRQSVLEAYSEEMKQIDSAKGLFVEAGKTLAAENSTLISDFASKMPNSRSGQSVNQTVAEFIAAPVVLTHADIRTAQASGSAGDGQLPWRLLYISLAALLAAVILRAVHHVRSRKRGAAGK